METKEFIEYLDKNEHEFQWAEGEHHDTPGYFVKNKKYETETHFTEMAIQNNDLPFLMLQTHHGKNVEQITRVTGFFSKVGSWNKGKLGELKERDRVEI